jgi:hypothetical protein
LNQIGRRLTESLEGVERRQQLLLMPDEFAAFGRLPGGLRYPRLPDLPTTEPAREGLWRKQQRSRQLPLPHRFRRKAAELSLCINALWNDQG